MYLSTYLAKYFLTAFAVDTKNWLPFQKTSKTIILYF